MSTKELFGDSSEDDDDDDEDDDVEQPEQNGAAASAAAAPAEASNNNNTVKGGGEENEEEKAAAPPPTGAAPASAPARKNIADSDNDDDDDDDDDEPEFDDQGAVVGLTRAAPTIKAAKEKEKAALQSFLAEDEDVGNGDDGDGPFSNDQPSKAPPPVVPKRIVDTRNTLVIQDTASIRPPPTSVSMYITKLPNLMGVQTAPFDPMTYSANVEEEDFGPSAVHNLVRWRYKTDPVSGQQVRDGNKNLVRESNTRLVEWEDGTFTIHVGAEAMEIDIKNNSDAQGFAGLNGYMYLSQKATLQTANGDKEKEKDGDNDSTTNDTISKPAGTVLECMGPIVSRMTARPSSLQSEAHKSLTLAVRQKTIKKARIAEFVTQEDPEKIKQERIKANTDLQRQKAQQQSRGGTGGGGGGGRRSGGKSRPRMSRAYLEGEEEEDDNYDSFNIRDTKRKMRDGDEDFDDDYGDDDDDDDANDTAFNRRGRGGASASSRRAGGAAAASGAGGGAVEKDEEIVLDDDNDDDDDDDDDDEDEAAPVVNKVKKAAHRATVFDDDDDSD